MALSRPDAPEAFRSVRTWLDLSGLLDGTPLVQWILARPLRTLWYRAILSSRGYDFRIARELTTESGGPLDFRTRLPPHLQAIHVRGFPLKRHLTNGLARRCFRRLGHLGPNDGGGIVLGELRHLPGLVYPVWGADHYLRPASGDIRNLVARVFRVLHETRFLSRPAAQ